MTTISTDAARHSTSAVVTASIASGEGLSDSDAAAIASWYATARGHGLTLHLLSQGTPVALDDVLAAIDAELSTAYDSGARELQALRAWAVSRSTT
jgi:hypothetical protein